MKRDINFMSAIKIIFRKATYCIGCGVCEANCPNGFISYSNGNIQIDDKCTKCRKCHEIFHGCLLANSLRLPKEENKMGSIDRYGNMGIQYSWVIEYFKNPDEFWTSANGLGTNMIKYLKSFLSDCNVIERKGSHYNVTEFRRKIQELGADNSSAWGLLLINLVYTSQFNWWAKNINFSYDYSDDELKIKLADVVKTNNSLKNVISGFKNIFYSNSILADEIGFGQAECEKKGKNLYLVSARRTPWQNPDPRVILYSLYKFAEECGDYYQFTLSRLLNHEIDSDGVSPTQIFGLDREKMEQLLNGLSINYPDFINASFTHDLDNITLRSEKTSKDVLSIF